jgi:hypothetical protein
MSKGKESDVEGKKNEESFSSASPAMLYWGLM